MVNTKNKVLTHKTYWRISSLEVFGVKKIIKEKLQQICKNKESEVFNHFSTAKRMKRKVLAWPATYSIKEYKCNIVKSRRFSKFQKEKVGCLFCFLSKKIKKSRDEAPKCQQEINKNAITAELIKNKKP